MDQFKFSFQDLMFIQLDNLFYNSGVAIFETLRFLMNDEGFLFAFKFFVNVLFWLHWDKNPFLSLNKNENKFCFQSSLITAILSSSDG